MGAPSLIERAIVALGSLWNYIINGDLVGYINAVYTGVVGPFYFGFLVLFVLMPLYLRSKSAIYVMIFWIVTGVALIQILPAGFYQVGAGLFYLIGGGLLFYVFRSFGSG